MMPVMRLCVLLVLVAQAACMVSPRPAVLGRSARAAMVKPRHALAQPLNRRSVFMSDAAAADDSGSSEEKPAKEVAAEVAGGLMETLKVGFLFGLWYVFNVVYNISNKKILNAFPFPWTMAVVQLGVGLLYLFPLWASPFRKAPKINWENIKNLTPIASMHGIGHLCTVVSLGAGAVSFTHIIKAAEPFFSTVMSAVFLKSFFPLPVYLALVPVVGGVAIASLTELSFSWVAFLNAMGSNTAFSLRAIFSKMAMDKPQGENMGAANLYGVLTVMSFVMLLPFALAIETPMKLKAGWDAAIAAGHSAKYLLQTSFISGLFYYLYNEVAFLCLDNVHPITHAVGNTIKRVVIILASVVVFGTPMTPLNKIGSSLAIAGVLLYSLAKNLTAQKKK